MFFGCTFDLVKKCFETPTDTSYIAEVLRRTNETLVNDQGF